MLFVLAELAALYTHYYEAFILLALNFYMLFFLLRRLPFTRGKPFSWKGPASGWLRAAGEWAGAQLVLAVLYLPFPLVLSNRVASYGEGSAKQGVTLWDIWQRTFSSFTLSETLDPGLSAWLWIPLALALGLILIWRWRRERRGIFFLLYAGIPTLAVFILSRDRPLFLERYLNGIAPAYYLLFAWGLAAVVTLLWPTLIRRGALAAGLAVFVILSLLALSNYFYNPIYAKSPDWRGLAQAIDAGSQKGDVILQNFPETSLVYYDHSRLPLVVYPTAFLPDKQTPQQLAGLNSKYQRVWFIPAAQDFWDPNHYVEDYLDAHDDLRVETRVGTFRLELYGTPASFLETMQPANATFGNFVELAGWRTRREGPTWRVVLYWRARVATKKNYNVFVQLRDARNQVLNQSDEAPVAGAYPTSRWQKDELVVDEHDLPVDPAGTALAVGMYDPKTSMRLPVTGLTGQVQSDVLVIPLPSTQ